MSNIIPILQSDGYKISHREQYPVGTEMVYSNWTPRGSRIPSVNKVILFGLQYYIKEYLIKQWNQNFFHRPLKEVVDEYTVMLRSYLGGNISTKHVEELHKLGYLPIAIRALPEGTRVPLRVPMFTIYNTLPQFFWLTNALETQLSCVIWQPCTSATIAFEYLKKFHEFADITGGSKDFIPFQGHDFSYRGMGGTEAAELSGAGHLLCFSGTDTIPAIQFLRDYYNADISTELVGCSVPATEHSVASVGSNGNDDFPYFEQMLAVYPNGIVSIVSDTYDYWRVITQYLPKLKSKIMSREGKVVIRPDCYDDKTQILTQNGWKLFSELNDGDLVSQVNDDNTFEFVKPTEIICQEYDGEMIHFTDEYGKLDLLVTPNHRMVYLQNNKEKIDEASKIKVGIWGKDFIRSVPYKTLGKTLSNLEKLKIAFQADGSYCTDIKSSIRFAFSKQRKIDRLTNLLNEMQLEYKIYNLSDNRKEFNIKIDSLLMSKNFDWVNLNQVDGQWCRDFIEELSHWDSSIRNPGRIKFDTTNKTVIEKVELIAVYAGYGVLISKYEDNRKEIFSDIYTANILLNNRIGGQSQNKNTIHYNGKVYCVKVPSGKIIVKRNKCILISGNSGDPVKIVCGDPDAPEGSPERKGSIECMWEIFGGTTNDKGYKTLDSHIGLIYGDSITMERQQKILEQLAAKGFASDNIVLGIGSFTYQYNTRDTFGFALKTTAAIVNGKFVPVFKSPKGDALKKSARGGLIVKEKNGELVLQDGFEELPNVPEDKLELVFLNGKLLVDHKISDIRARIRSQL